MSLLGAELVQPADGAVERDPRHHLGVGEVLSRAAHLPDALVGPLPSVLEEIEERQYQVEGVGVAVGDGPVTALVSGR